MGKLNGKVHYIIRISLALEISFIFIQSQLWWLLLFNKIAKNYILMALIMIPSMLKSWLNLRIIWC